MKRETLTCPQNLKICTDTNFKKGGLLLSSNDRAVVISVAGSIESEILDVSAEVILCDFRHSHHATRAGCLNKRNIKVTEVHQNSQTL